MIQRTRSFFRDSEPAIATIVGVVGGFALYQAFVAIGYGFVLPILFHGPDRLTFTFGGVTFNYQQLVPQLVGLLLLSAVGYVLFIWRGDESPDADPGRRDCPECKSEIWIDARPPPVLHVVVNAASRRSRRSVKRRSPEQTLRASEKTT